MNKKKEGLKTRAYTWLGSAQWGNFQKKGNKF